MMMRVEGDDVKVPYIRPRIPTLSEKEQQCPTSWRKHGTPAQDAERVQGVGCECRRKSHGLRI